MEDVAESDIADGRCYRSEGESCGSGKGDVCDAARHVAREGKGEVRGNM